MITTPLPNDTPQILTGQQLADLLGVHRRTLSKWRQDGTLPPANKLGRAWVWHRDAIEAWIARGCPPQEAAE
ncbi:MAG: helix-turn-helix domain-containing protein [Planctomycetaceae bacterium]|nr:helix-turn-helix domain-containing protein [Planctomycetaceae bacterium]